MSAVVCPRCGGKGKQWLEGFCDYSDGTGSYERWEAECFMCCGTGKVPEGHDPGVGLRMRVERVEAGKSLGDAARDRGISVAEYSRLERGGAPRQ